MVKTGKIYGINGPVVYIKGKTDFQMGEMVYVSEEKLVGEIIGLTSEMTTVQVYEETSGLKPGELVYGTGTAIFVTLAPGILNNIFDGIERPLSKIREKQAHSSAVVLVLILLIQQKNGMFTLQLNRVIMYPVVQL